MCWTCVFPPSLGICRSGVKYALPLIVQREPSNRDCFPFPLWTSEEFHPGGFWEHEHHPSRWSRWAGVLLLPVSLNCQNIYAQKFNNSQNTRKKKKERKTSLNKLHSDSLTGRMSGVSWFPLTAIFLLFSGYKVLSLLEMPSHDEKSVEQADVYVHVTFIKKWDICAGAALLNALGKATHFHFLIRTGAQLVSFLLCVPSFMLKSLYYTLNYIQKGYRLIFCVIFINRIFSHR